MAKEKAGYAATKKDIEAAFPGRKVLNVTQVQAYTGLGYRAVNSHFRFTGKNGKRLVSIEDLARQLCV